MPKLGILPMDRTLVAKAIEGYPSVLGEEVKAQDAFYSSFSCPRCGETQLRREAHPVRFSSDYALPRSLLVCPRCDHTVDPHSGITVKLGNVGKIPVDIPILDPNSEEG